MNNDFDNTNNGALFVNDRRQNDKSPDFKGQCEPACPSCGAVHKFWLSAWKKKARNGNGFLSLAFTADDQSVNSTPKKAESKGDDPFDFDDEIPF
jgi:hypothetical protein